jgi:ferrous iron transport protein B
VTSLLGLIGLDDTWVRGLLVDGLIAGVGMLLSFIPLMAIMFMLLAVLEDSGYMARAAVVTDRLMRAIGLPGRAFLPLIVGFGCNVPAIAATRVLPDARHRLLTTLLVPFTSCTARLTVYVMIATIFFPSRAGSVVFAMYVISILFVVAVGLLLRKTLWRTMGNEPLILDLPPYQQPTLRLTATVTWLRLKGFLRTASGIIVATVIAVWFLQAIPMPGTGSFSDVPVQDSVYAAGASVVAPVFAPAGFGNWEAASALMVGFVAKEAVISSWSQTYATAEPTSPDTPGNLGAMVKEDFTVSSGGHPGAAAWAFLVFLLAYTPCVATLAAQRREIGSRWTAFGVGMQLTVAWLIAVAVFQIGSRLG